MKVCLTTKNEIINNQEIINKIKRVVPELNIIVLIKPRKQRKRTETNKKNINKTTKRVIEKKNSNITKKYKKIKMLSYYESQKYLDKQYIEFHNEESLNKIVEYYKNIKNMQEF